MRKIEYKFVKLPHISLKSSVFKNGNDINDLRIGKLEEEFNSLGKDGWVLIDIYWLEGIALFKREL